MDNKYLDIDYFLKSVDDKDWHVILDECNKRVTWAENIKTKSRDDEYTVRTYVQFVKNLGFFLSQGIKPATMNERDFNRTKPLIEKLINKGQLSSSYLELYN